MTEPLFSVPPNWEVSTVGKVAARGGGDVQTGPFGSQLHASDYVEVGIPSVMPQNIGDNTISTDGIARIRPEDAERLSKYQLRSGDIVYSRRGDVEKRSLVRPENDGWLCGTGCLRIRFGAGHVVPEYAGYYLAHPAAKAWVVQHAVGATMPNLNTKILASLPFVLPPLRAQAAISSILSSLDDKIELNRRMNETLEAMAQAIFRDWFVDFGPTRRKLEGASDPITIMGGLVQDTVRAQALADLFPAALGDDGLPEGWTNSTLDSEFNVQIGRTPPRKEHHHFVKNGAGVPWMSIRDLGEAGVFIHETAEEIAQESITLHRVPLIQEGTVVVSFKLTVGRVAITEQPMLSNEAIAQLGRLDVQQKPWFPYLWMKSYDYSRLGSTSSIATAVNSKSIKGMDYLVPARFIAQEFDDIVGPIFGRIRCLSAENRTLSATRDLLLPKLMSGEIRLSEAEYLAEAVQ